VTYVYILQSLGADERFYVGITGDLRSRLEKHNAGEVPHTSRYAPWRINISSRFRMRKQAFAVEMNLNSPSEKFFLKKRL
jgi:putative endonuclease